MRALHRWGLGLVPLGNSQTPQLCSLRTHLQAWLSTPSRAGTYIWSPRCPATLWDRVVGYSLWWAGSKNMPTGNRGPATDLWHPKRLNSSAFCLLWPETFSTQTWCRAARLMDSNPPRFSTLRSGDRRAGRISRVWQLLYCQSGLLVCTLLSCIDLFVHPVLVTRMSICHLYVCCVDTWRGVHVLSHVPHLCGYIHACILCSYKCACVSACSDMPGTC